LHAYVVMPNHVPLMVTPHVMATRWLGPLKGFTPKETQRSLGTTGKPFWLDESYVIWSGTANSTASESTSSGTRRRRGWRGSLRTFRGRVRRATGSGHAAWRRPQRITGASGLNLLDRGGRAVVRADGVGEATGHIRNPPYSGVRRQPIREDRPFGRPSGGGVCCLAINRGLRSIRYSAPFQIVSA